MEPPSKMMLGEYELLETLGVGAFSKVKKALHVKAKVHVAIKILSRKKILAQRMQEKVRREIHNLKSFRHPHVIGLYEVISTTTHIFLVMEFVPNGELFEYIVANTKLREPEARRCFQQLICGLEYCHAQNVVHRDLKPENVLMDEANNVKIADFGLSNRMVDGDFLHTSCGSPNYAAPEVISAQSYAGPEVDVWSAGVILYAMLCGSLPFDDDNIPNLFRKIREGAVRCPAYVSQHGRDLILKMLDKDPLKRITISQIRAHPWFQVNVPPYLQSSSFSSRQESKRDFDADIAAAVACLGCHNVNSIEEVRSMVLAKGTNAASVSYDLLLDAKLAKQRAKELAAIADGTMREPDVRPLTFMPSGSAALPGTPRTPAHADAAAAHRRSSAASVSAGAAAAAAAAAAGSPAGSTASAKHKRHFYLGIQSKKPPAHVMKEVYRALGEAHCKWVHLDTYAIKCKYPADDAPTEAPKHQVKLKLQLYRVALHHGVAIYLLDLERLVGDAMCFMNLSARIIMCLKTRPTQAAAPAPAAAAAAVPRVMSAARQTSTPIAMPKAHSNVSAARSAGRYISKSMPQ